MLLLLSRQKLLMGALALLLVVGVAGSRSTATEWRRTRQGWELVAYLPRALRSPVATRIHPGVIASLQVMVSAAALLYFTQNRSHPPQGRSEGDPCDTLPPLVSRSGLTARGE